MATTSIWAIKGTASSIHRVEMYIENPEKTTEQDALEYQSGLHRIDNQGIMTHEFSEDELTNEKICYVSGINCSVPGGAWKEFAAIYDMWGKPCEGRVCYHGYQSFRQGEVTAEQAHEIGVRLAEELWGDRFQVVVATHLNTDHYHNHILLNAISFADGLKFVNRKSDYRRMRKVSDALCREYGISVIENPGQGGKHYGEWKAEREGRPTERGNIRLDLDIAVQKLSQQKKQPSRPNVRNDIRSDMDIASKEASTMQEMIRIMEEMGYEWNFSGQHPKIKPPGKDRYFRLYKLGKGYNSLETLARRVLHMHEMAPDTKMKMPPMYYQYHKNYRVKQKRTGFVALYYYHCYRLGVFTKRKYPQNTPELRSAQKQLHQMFKVTIFLRNAGIHNLESFELYWNRLHQEISDCKERITMTQQELVQSNDLQENADLVHQLENLRVTQSELLEKKELCRLVIEQQHIGKKEERNEINEEENTEEKRNDSEP